MYQAEYIWVDGTEPTPLLRSKTKILNDDVTTLPDWNFDGSSANQAAGDRSDMVLRPVFQCHDPIRGGRNVLVMCEVLMPDGVSAHPTNKRAMCAAAETTYEAEQMWFGLEQEYTMLRLDGSPLGFPRGGGLPEPQGPYYCGVGAKRIVGRQIVEIHTQACIDAGLAISGTNPEVMPGQWEFQIGPLGPTAVGDQVHVARWLLERIAEDFDVVISLDAKPVRGTDWNGAGCHTNFSSVAMREGWDAIIDACEAIGAASPELVKHYGHGLAERLIGTNETATLGDFSYGVSDRNCSIRIPLQVERDGKGYAEDRRPNANIDPYTVAGMITDTVCGAARAKARPKRSAKKVAPKKTPAKKATARKRSTKK